MRRIGPGVCGGRPQALLVRARRRRAVPRRRLVPAPVLPRLSVLLRGNAQRRCAASGRDIERSGITQRRGDGRGAIAPSDEVASAASARRRGWQRRLRRAEWFGPPPRAARPRASFTHDAAGWGCQRGTTPAGSTTWSSPSWSRARARKRCAAGSCRARRSKRRRLAAWSRCWSRALPSLGRRFAGERERAKCVAGPHALFLRPPPLNIAAGGGRRPPVRPPSAKRRPTTIKKRPHAPDPSRPPKVSSDS